MRLDFFVKLKYQSSTTILFIRNKYSVRGLFCDVIHNVWRYASHMGNNVSSPSGISSPQQAV